MTDSGQTSTRIIGSLRLDAGVGAVRIDDLYDTDIDDLWSAITEPSRLARWLAVVDDAADLRVGGRFHARFTSSWEGEIRVDVCDAPNRLLVSSVDEDGDETVTEAVLTTEGAKTRLVIEERGFTLDQVAAHGAGWQAHAEDLAAVIAGGERGDWLAQWQHLAPTYNAMAAELR
jgi:uncharacterized protein YndB with AHSA1/START domain